VIPLSSDRPLRRPSLINPILVALNVGVFLFGALYQRLEPRAFEALQGSLVLIPGEALQRPWTLLSFAFLHGGLMHILGNMLFLWVFGANVEDRLGRIGYLAFYLLGAGAAGALFAGFEKNPVLGASGAVAAVTGAYLVLFPRTQIRTVFFWFAIGAYDIPAWWFIGAQVAWNLWQQSTHTSGNVATLAHLGGYAYGAGIAMLLLATGILKREVYDLFSITKQAARRREFREIESRRRRAAAQGKSPEQALRKRTAPEPVVDQLAADRAEVTLRLGDGDLSGAAAAYRALLDRYLAVPGATLLSRKTQYDLGNALHAAGDHATAARAYEIFLEGYPKDHEAPTVRLMLGIINARYLNDPVRAKSEIARALPGLDEDHSVIARDVLAELG
jgi:membrane associated rhomboid family serine protease